MNICQINKCDIANGTGIRISLFVSGCTNHCPGCFQPETWDFDFGKKYTSEMEDAIIKELHKDFYEGITILGGEPMELSNQAGILPLILRIKKEMPNKSIWIYSGFTYETDLCPGGKRYCEYTDQILNNIEVLVDGKFILDQANISLNFRGSANQRIIDMRKTRETGQVVLSPLNN